jgi:hypothetical protein
MKWYGDTEVYVDLVETDGYGNSVTNRYEIGKQLWNALIASFKDSKFKESVFEEVSGLYPPPVRCECTVKKIEVSDNENSG